MRHRSRPLLIAERASWALGLVGLMWWGSFHIGLASSARHDLERFATLQALAAPAGTPDLTLWSPQRVSAWRMALEDAGPAPLAVLRIPKIRLEVAVLPGTDDRTLDRGAGHIEDTPPPGAAGNSGIAAAICCVTTRSAVGWIWAGVTPLRRRAISSRGSNGLAM